LGGLALARPAPAQGAQAGLDSAVERHGGKSIRIVDLANTTSSPPDWPPELPAGMSGLPPDSALRVKIDRYKDLDRKDFLRALHTVKLDVVPGAPARHSNAGAQLLGRRHRDPIPLFSLLPWRSAGDVPGSVTRGTLLRGGT
jgi:hypothetical protein